MRLTITSVDYAPPELDEQVPIDVELLREFPGDDRPDYWLGATAKPLHWIDENIERTVTHLVLVARWQGTQIAPGAKNLPVGIAYVTDSSLLKDERFILSKSRYVAVGLAHDAVGGKKPVKFKNGLAGAIGRAFEVGSRS